ncbi:MAG: CHASE domain-containing protein [Actinomycetota bacterium]
MNSNPPLTHPKNQWQYRPVCFIFVAGVLLSTAASLMVNNWEKVNQIYQFQNQIDKLATSLQGSAIRNLEFLKATGRFYAASNEITREDFHIYVQDILANHSSIDAFNWTPRVLAKERIFFEKTVQAEGFHDFKITERKQSGKLVSAGERPEYFPITYAERVQDKKPPIGYDLASEPMRREALEKARDTGQISASRWVKIVSNNQVGFLAFQPIYRRGKPINTISNRRLNFLGVTTVIFKIEGIVKAALEGLDSDNFDFYIFDDSTASQGHILSFYQFSTKQIQLSSTQTPPISKDAYSLCINLAACTRYLKVADRQWSLLVVPKAGSVNWMAYWRSGVTLLSGFLLTIILSIYVLMSVRHTLQVEKLVAEQTAQALQLREQATQLQLTLNQLRQTQSQLIQTEKMSSLGQLVAGVAHEINNPVNFIYGNLVHISEYTEKILELLEIYAQKYHPPVAEIAAKIEEIDLDFLKSDLPQLENSMKVGTERIREIVKSLRTFSRLDESETKEVDIHEGLESTLMILQSRITATSTHPAIKVIKEYGKLPLVECYAGQLNQVFMNLLTNAIDALDERAAQLKPDQIKAFPYTIRITTSVLDQNIIIRITDNGVGISESVKQRLFDPFFTTKPIGKGTGLGLAVSYQVVVDKHGGILRCESSLGQGTEFWVEIPIKPGQNSSASG